MNPPQPCPVTSGPLDFNEPIYCTFDRIQTIRAIAAAKGFKIIRCSLCGALYRLDFGLAGHQPTIDRPLATDSTTRDEAAMTFRSNSTMASGEPGQVAGGLLGIRDQDASGVKPDGIARGIESL